ncbi:MAG: hypothetical protein K0Q50_2538 [Vampirovibrio sp.]|jgi:hypothetical protein|nr:hypothetical protein [Vampirovibrio sp.]
MDENKTINEVLKVVNQLVVEMKQMNKTLSVIAGQGKGASEGPAGRSMPSRNSAGFTPRRNTKSPGFKRSDELSSGAEDTGNRFPRKKSPARPSSGKPPAKKGGGYPKKPR